MELFNNKKHKLFAKTVLDAAEQCSKSSEEEGGIILSRDDEYKFVKVKNIHTGTEKAYGLYETDKKDLLQQVFSQFDSGWFMCASFHTHPTFGPTPSTIDVKNLFEGFRYNVIYSTISDMFSYSEWLEENSTVCYIPAASFEKIRDQK